MSLTRLKYVLETCSCLTGVLVLFIPNDMYSNSLNKRGKPKSLHTYTTIYLCRLLFMIIKKYFLSVKFAIKITMILLTNNNDITRIILRSYVTNTS